MLTQTPGHRSRSRHLFVVLTDSVSLPGYTENSVLLVSISTARSGDLKFDPTCVLEAGVHRFITHRSYVLYARAQTHPMDDLLRAVAESEAELLGQMDPEILNRICQGVQASARTLERMERFYREAMNLHQAN